MKKYQYLASWDDQTLTRVGEPVVVLGDSNVSQVEVTMPSNFLLVPTEAVARMYFLLPGEKESDFETLDTATQDENGDYHVAWTIKHAHTQKGGRLAFSLTLIGDDAQWDSRTAILPVHESRYQPESEEAEEPYAGRLTALEGSMASIRGEFAEVQDDFEELKETVTLGTPIPESLVANMTEGHVYIYTGTEPGYTAGHVYYYVGGTLTDGGVYGGTAVDATLTQSGAAADAKVTGDKIAEIKEDLSQKIGLSEEAKQALLACFRQVAWVNEHGQNYYDALENALYPPADLVRITAVYTPSHSIHVTSKLDELRDDLVVSAFYTNGTEAVVDNYTLSGTLIEGTSTITVTYGGKTTTIDVTVSGGIYIKLTKDDFVYRRRNTTNAPNYYAAWTSGVSYSNFDLMVSGGKTYKVTFDASYDTAQVGAQFWNQTALDNVEAGINLSNNDKFDPGWLTSGAEFEVPLQLNGSDIKCVRFTSRQDTNNTALSADFTINYMILEEV